MKILEQNRQTLMVDLHRLIEEQTHRTIEKIFDHPLEDRSIYPPDISKTDEEKQALSSLQFSDELKGALEKTFKDNTATVLFRLLSIMDGTGLPAPESGPWSKVMLVDKPEDHTRPAVTLHDLFFESYWDWKEKQPEKNVS